MQYKFNKTIIINLGGSIIFPNDIDTSFVKKFRFLIKNQVQNKKKKFIIITGGGKICRLYQNAAARIDPQITNQDKDWIGIQATRCNAHLLRAIFGGFADPKIIDGPAKVKFSQYPITIASGWRPGWSTDYVAVSIAKKLKIKEVIVATKPDYIYTGDPEKHKDAKPIKEMNWQEVKKLIPKKWTPGANTPVDPIAANLAQKEGIGMIFINGRKLKNFKNLFEGKDFIGTTIRLSSQSFL